MDLIAKTTIVRGKPGNQETIRPGRPFKEPNKEEAKRLLNLGAAELPGASEEAAEKAAESGEKGDGSGGSGAGAKAGGGKAE